MHGNNGQQDLFPEAPVWWEGLTGRRRLFVEYYCTDRTCFLNATAAFIKAYSKPGKELTDSSIQSNASRMLREPKVQQAINKLLRARQNNEDQLNEFKMLDILKTLAFYNPRDIIDNYGALKKPIEDMGDLAYCIADIKRNRHGSEIKLYDRTKAMDILGRYLDIIRPPEGVVNVNPNIFLADKELEQMHSAEKAASPAAEDAEYEVMDNPLPGMDA